jgi:hypothetical protein
MPPVRGAWAAFGMYVLLSLLYFGLPALDDFGTSLVAAEEIEPSAFQWFLAWWPDAIADGRNPFVTHDIYAPTTINMTWVTSIPGLSLVFAPVTLLFGPVETYNLVTLLAPALAGLAAFLLCRHLTNTFWPSVAGGYLFGFGPFMLIALAGIPSHSFTALIAVAAYLVVRGVDGTLPTRTFVVLLALTLAGQFLISVEVFAMLTVLGALVAVVAYLLLAERRKAMRQALPAVVVAYAGAMVLVSPFLWHMLFEPYLEPSHAIPDNHSIDLLGFFVPTSLVELGSGAFPDIEAKLGGAIPVAGGGGSYAYLGLPLIAIVALFAKTGWRDPARRVLVLSAVILAALSLGPRLWVAGENVMPAPGVILRELPMLEYALPSRFPVYTALVLAVILAMWLATHPSRWKWALAGVSLLFILPNFGSGTWSATTSSPPFFSAERYDEVLDRADIVFAVPVVGASVRWHAEAGMPFRLANGYIGRIPDDLSAFYDRLHAAGPLDEARIRRFLTRRRISVLLIAGSPEELAGWRRRLAFLGVAPRAMDGVLLYRLAPPRGTPRLTTSAVD